MATGIATATQRSFDLAEGRTKFEAISCLRFASSALPLRLSRPSRFASLVVSARRGKKVSPAVKSRGGKKGKKSIGDGETEEDAMDEDAFEKLFSLLEEDLKNDGLSGDDFDDEISEEELEKLERELAAALAGDDFEDEDEDEDNDEVGDEDDEDSASSKALSADDDSEEEEDLALPKLKNWQLRRLASALKIGRRKSNIKALSAELGLERAVVLEFLREPPPNLLLMAASLPDKKPTEKRQPDPVEEEAVVELPLPPAEAQAKSEPVHVMKAQWSTSKRMKKVQLETLERVYDRTRRPTNAMISSIVHTTNLPRKKVVQWFEDRRVEDGEPERRRPFRRSEHGSVFS